MLPPNSTIVFTMTSFLSLQATENRYFNGNPHYLTVNVTLLDWLAEYKESPPKFAIMSYVPALFGADKPDFIRVPVESVVPELIFRGDFAVNEMVLADRGVFVVASFKIAVAENVPLFETEDGLIPRDIVVA